MVVLCDIPLHLLTGGPLIRIIAHHIHLFLFQTAVKAFRDGIVRGTTHPGEGELGFELLKESLCHPRRIRRPPDRPGVWFLGSPERNRGLDGYQAPSIAREQDERLLSPT